MRGKTPAARELLDLKNNKKSRLPGIHFLLQHLPGINKTTTLANLKVQVGAGGIA